MTSNALRSYQRSHSLKVTGVATPAVWRKLQTGAKYRPLAAPRRASRSVSSSSQGARIVAFAKRQLGDSYVYGATGPNAWDCSGLTSGAYKSVGKYIPRTSQPQFRSGTKVSKGTLRPGGLVFFYSGISHVAIYAGNGYVVHAANPRSDVAMLKMSYMPYMGARRY